MGMASGWLGGVPLEEASELEVRGGFSRACRQAGRWYEVNPRQAGGYR